MLHWTYTVNLQDVTVCLPDVNVRLPLYNVNASYVTQSLLNTIVILPDVTVF